MNTDRMARISSSVAAVYDRRTNGMPRASAVIQRRPGVGGQVGRRSRVGVVAVAMWCGIVACMLPHELMAAEGETMASRGLRLLVERQRELFADAEKQGDRLDESSFRNQMESLARDYEIFLRDNPRSADGYAAYGYLLSKVDMRQEAAAMLLKANQLDPNIPLVKNQLGNYLAEEGKPLQAAPYFIAAIKLAPNEPLYHYQLGSLLTEARDDFLKSGEWTRTAIDEAMHTAFRRATELAPDRFEFAYRYAESFYDLENPDWAVALKLWGELEEKAATPIERQMMRLHAANVCLKLGKRDHAEALLLTVTEPNLQAQKEKLLAGGARAKDATDGKQPE